jgi:hypothetical protein
MHPAAIGPFKIERELGRGGREKAIFARRVWRDGGTVLWNPHELSPLGQP